VKNWVALVRVVLKPAVNDPQGLAIRGGLRQLGFTDVESVRAGKVFEIRFGAADQSTADMLVAEMCRRLLANPVIEDFSYELTPASDDGAAR
jgi:phosphoribosylformylglycinamidine synthase PurS subunit